MEPLSTDENCASIALEALDHFENSNECRSLQMTAFLSCGCPTRPNKPLNSSPTTCNVCPDGSPVNEKLMIPEAALPPNLDFEIQGLDVTCGQAALVATTLNDDDAQCEKISTLAPFCGCPEPQEHLQACTVCSDGQPVPFPERVLPNGVTCERAQEIASETFRSHDCAVLQNYASDACGCEAKEEEEPSQCTSVCPDGSSVPYFDREIEEVNGRTLTCGELEDQIYLGLADPERCEAYHFIGVQVCGCREMKRSSCSLCEDGSLPPSLFQDVDDTASCVDLAAQAAYTNNPDQCTAFQATAGVMCGCENPIASQNACRLCGNDRFLPDPSRIADEESEISCGEAEYVGTIAPQENVCRALVKDYSEVCCFSDDFDTATDLIPQSEGGQDLASDATAGKSTMTAIFGCTLAALLL